MPFVNIKVAGPRLSPPRVAELQEGVTRLMVDILHKVGPLVAVLVEQVDTQGWSIGAQPVACAAQVDAVVSAGTNTPAEKAQFIGETHHLLRNVLGPGLAAVSYVIVHEVPKNSWGYDGVTQACRP
jgi:4-oxalocrotonate tautomerase